MKRYVALLRGINISGKNKIAMSELKAGFAELGYTAVSTYLNSGNVVFCADIDDKEGLSNEIRSMINKRFGLDIPVFVVSQEELEDILKNAPEWWGDSNKEIYDNLIFMFPNISYDSFYNEVGNPKEEYEKIYHYKNVIFWSFSRKDYQKTNWWSKTASSKISDRITIRTANTVRKNSRALEIMKPERTRRAAVAAMAKPRRPVHREKWPGYWKYSFRSRLVMAR